MFQLLRSQVKILRGKQKDEAALTYFIYTTNLEHALTRDNAMEIIN